MKLVTVYERDGKRYVIASSKTTAGVWVEQAPCSIVEGQASAAVLGGEIVRRARDSAERVPHPSSWKGESENPVHVAAGVRTVKAFMVGTKSVSVELHKTHVAVIPTRNAGHREGFIEIADKTTVMESPVSEVDIGTEVTKQLLVAV